MAHRNGEDGVIPPRSGRFAKKDGYWYYNTREGVDIGPFDSLTEAEAGAVAFIDYIRSANPGASDVLKRYRAA